MGIPIILSLYLKPHRASRPCFMATNSAPNIDVSTIDCFFENHCTNAVFMYIKKTLLNMQENLSPAWSLSTNMQISISFPQGIAAFMDVAFLASL